MKIIKNIKEIKKILNEHRNNNQQIALVPTMGALHEGHISLIKKANQLAEIVVVSIFVNKTQFNDLSDYEKYPRQLNLDFCKLENQQVDYIFAPDSQEIFPENCDFIISPQALANCLCGSSRAGHFEGVALIITKLFNIILPNFAIFGQKDFQQLLIIKKLVENLNFNVEIHEVETLREASGLAMSSRNQRLNDDQLKLASEIFRILNEIKNNFYLDPQILEKKSQEMLAIGFKKVEYLEVRDEQNLQLISSFQINKPMRIFIAVYLDEVRLIDNLQLIKFIT
jgi:pantoate--beta-alanine ligase